MHPTAFSADGTTVQHLIFRLTGRGDLAAAFPAARAASTAPI